MSPRTNRRTIRRTSRTPAIPLTIAGSDPSGGAGLQADLKVFLRFGLSAAAVPTAITVQSPSGVAAVVPLQAALVGRQLTALLRDVRPAAVKIGLLGDAGIVRTVARALRPLRRQRVPIVVDPVLASGDGRRLLPRSAVPVFVRELLPLATLLTPNAAEAAELTGVPARQLATRTSEVLDALLATGAGAILLKGGHLGGSESTDLLHRPDGTIAFSLPRVAPGRRVHGAGCALSTAIAALLAQGWPLEEACQHAKAYVHAAIAGSRRIGRGVPFLDLLAER
jgi:hydroxymethylpyrimidine/phosphomethylpyrimidine kinase